MHNLHEKLKSKYQWYELWHKHPHHSSCHWAIFVIVSYFLILGGMSKISPSFDGVPLTNQALATGEAKFI